MMRKIVLCACILLAIIVLPTKSHGQEQKRDTSLFVEHQVLFEHMDFIPAEFPVLLYRIYKTDTSILRVHSDPYWISNLVSNQEYQSYLKAIQRDSSLHSYEKALPGSSLQSQQIEQLNISLKTYNSDGKYEHYPVLGLSWMQANRFCQWKTAQVNQELEQVNLPHEKIYRIPLQAEIEAAKRFTDIHLPRLFKTDTNLKDENLIAFYKTIDEWTGEVFIESEYLNGISNQDEGEQMIIYFASDQRAIPFKNKNASDVNTGFRYVQTYRKVPNSK